MLNPDAAVRTQPECILDHISCQQSTSLDETWPFHDPPGLNAAEYKAKARVAAAVFTEFVKWLKVVRFTFQTAQLRVFDAGAKSSALRRWPTPALPLKGGGILVTIQHHRKWRSFLRRTPDHPPVKSHF
jgi:hypothetical protein